ncbi:MAG: RtcB family protein [Clostridium sp.]
MIEIKGRVTTARVYTDIIEEEARRQIETLCSEEFMKGVSVAVMPDVHAGKGCTIGTTLYIKDKVVPNLVGVDIGCGVITACLGKVDIDFNKLDSVIREHIPTGVNIRKTPHPMASKVALNTLRCTGDLKIDRAELSIGTLGSGNHFIEINESRDGVKFLCIHSGSRNIGNRLAQYYQEVANSKNSNKVQDKSLAYLEGEDFYNYIHDMKIIQEYANINREAMASVITEKLGLNIEYQFNTVHNYIDTDNMILRKGAVSAKKGEKLLIPINMRDGSLICEGLGNSNWNYSAPHGAGRLMSRTQSKKNISMDEFMNSMKGIYSTTVSSSTLDEAPQAYKPIENITSNIGETAKVIDHIRPIYNFKG